MSARISSESQLQSLPNFCACCLWPWLGDSRVTKSQGKVQFWGFSSPLTMQGTHTKLENEPILALLLKHYPSTVNWIGTSPFVWTDVHLQYHRCRHISFGGPLEWLNGDACMRAERRSIL